MLNTLVHNHYVHKGSLWAIYIATLVYVEDTRDARIPCLSRLKFLDIEENQIINESPSHRK